METIDNMDSSSLYRLSGKYIVGTELVGLEVSDYKGNKKLLKLADVHELIRRELIHECRLVEYEGNILIKSSTDKIATLPLISKEGSERKNKFSVTARVFKDRRLIGYKVSDKDGKVYNLSKDKVWGLAKINEFENVSASISNGVKILRGVGIKLTDLPTLNV